MTLNIATPLNNASLVVWAAVNDDQPIWNDYPLLPITPTPLQLQILTDFDNSQYAYEALGAALSSAPNFLRFANIQDDTAFVTAAAGYAFHQPESPAQIASFVGQLHFLEGFYSAAHLPNYELVAKGAVFGLMLGVETELVPIVGTSMHV
jgi:hypothetical protein